MIQLRIRYVATICLAKMKRDPETLQDFQKMGNLPFQERSFSMSILLKKNRGFPCGKCVQGSEDGIYRSSVYVLLYRLFSDKLKKTQVEGTHG